MRKFLQAVLWTVCLCLPAAAAGPAIWTVHGRSEVLKGEAKGVSVDQNGIITLAPEFTEVFKTGQPYVWSTAVDTAGNIFIGTGSDGKIFKVDAAGRGALFADLAELNVTALAFAKNGDLFASTSPDGKVYRLDSSGKAEVYFDPKEKYIWSLAVMADGSLAVGTGEAGKIYRVRAANASPESSLLFDSSETHIITLVADRQGDLYAGTDPGGLVLKFSADGKPFALLDSPLREVHQLVLGPGGSLYALALGESASGGSPEPAATPDAKPASPAASRTPAPAQQKSRYDLTGAKSAIYRIAPDGGNDIIWATNVAGFSIFPSAAGNGVLVGTSDKGRIYGISDGGDETLVLQSDAGQISTFVSTAAGIFAASSNQGNLYRMNAVAAEGSYESAVLDATSAAAWGRIWWQANGNVQLQTRSGNTENPDETWGSWSTSYGDQKGVAVSSPKARFLQWRALLRSSAAAASLSEVNISYLGRNIAPEVLQIQVLPTNVGLAPNPAAQIDPNIELSGLDPAVFGLPNTTVPPRKVYQRAATSLQWTADDRNDDKLVYDVLYKELGASTFKMLRENISENFLTVDGQSLADGRYVFKVVAKDAPSNPADTALTGERTSEPIEIDNTPPTVTAAGAPTVAGDRIRVAFDAADASSYISRAEFSVNGGDWQAVFPNDGISDGPRERYTVEVQVKMPGEYSITLRAFDANANSGNARVTVRK
jgi:hypothetical protein